MKVWILIGGYNYEGFCEPVGVFASQEDAEAAERLNGPQTNRYDTLEILEYPLIQSLDHFNELNPSEHCVCGSWFYFSEPSQGNAKEALALWRQKHEGCK